MTPSVLGRAALGLLVMLLSMTTVVEAALWSTNSKVTLVDSKNFRKEVLDIEKPTMVAFTAPWCGHCQRLVPDYTKVAAQLDGVVKLAAIDCDQEANKPLCGSYGIQGFPTLKLFPPTKKRLPKDYQGPRTAKDIAAYMVDALPMGAKKLKAEQLQQYTDSDVETPKVILFSKKPTSSPLYKSLALDFRTSLNFAFLRGDQQPVRSAARLHLGVSVDESKLPLLVVVPSRSQDEQLDKASIKTYTGKLNYHQLNQWIKDNVPEAKSRKSKKAKLASSNTQVPKKKPVKLDQDIDELPVGAQREWRIEDDMTEEQRRAKMQKLADMINEAAAKRQAAEHAESLKDTVGQGYDSVKQKVFDAGAEAADKVQEAVNDARESVEESYESIKHKVKEAVASSDADTFAESSGSGHSWSSSSSYSSSTDEDGNVVEDRSASYSTSGDDTSDENRASSYKLNSHSSYKVDSDGADMGYGDDSVSLKENLQRWLEGEKVDWSAEYSEQFKDAQAAAEKLVRENPEQAEKMALESEKWLAEHLISDIELMKLAREKGNNDPSISDEKIQRVEKMYDEIKRRIHDRESRGVNTPDIDPPPSHHDEL
ncbi:thioredoxin-domain-containing protein [Testicularia cyperi]|uniref:Thioredoxin-domain-containing protein n=1 Tax=Testicularia cyperi TaxID=1882483 RepID=A0A317XZB5_9BASI|nr:thioredoxin-domain-containing protein [Testicularia cyperi]